MLAIMNKTHTAYSMFADRDTLNDKDVIEWYERHKETYTNKNSHYYGSQLVSTKLKKVGFEVKFDFTTLRFMRPMWDKYDKSFMFLWFKIVFSYKTIDVFDKVVKDWLSPGSI